MNQEQKDYISLLNSSSENDILIKKTGWEEISLHAHSHEKYQIIYTLSGTLHIQIYNDSYFVPEKHIAWIPGDVIHEINSNNRQVSLVIFYFSPLCQPENIRTSSFCIYNTNSVIEERSIKAKEIGLGKMKRKPLYIIGFTAFYHIRQNARRSSIMQGFRYQVITCSDAA